MIPKVNRSLINGVGKSSVGRGDNGSLQFLLGSSSEEESIFPLCIDDDEEGQHTSMPTQVTLSFHLDDGTCQKLVVEENLRAIDLCHLLPLKINLAKSHTWTLVEQLQEIGIERCLEDHEEVLSVFGDWGPETAPHTNKFLFRQDFRKYEFFHSPQEFFPLKMLDLGEEFDCLSESKETAKLVTLQNLLNSGERVPPVRGHMWCREPGKHSWRRLLFHIKDSTLCATESHNNKIWRDLHLHDLYTPIEGKFKSSPTQYAFCLRPHGFGVTSLSLVWFCLESERERQCWLAALRLAKFGKKLRENYKEIRARFTDSKKDANEAPLSKSMVAMDFTGSFGRVVEDPKEAEAIAAAEGHSWKRRLASSCRTPGSGSGPGSPDQVVSPGPRCVGNPSNLPVHTLQPWFYNNMNREESTQLLNKYGTVDGVFLVRESRRNPGCFVLCYVFKNKVHHAQIIPVEEKDQLCFSLDGGRTKFYDLLQLVEFYQLNLGALPTKLTHFLVHRSK